MSMSFDSNYTVPIDITQIAAQASNINGGTNPPYAILDFISFYPQFAGQITDSVLSTIISISNSRLDYQKYNEQWTFAMALMTAHYVTLYQQSIISGKASGVATSKSVGDVSISYQNIIDDEWGDLNLTVFGRQLIGIAKISSKGGMWVM